MAGRTNLMRAFFPFAWHRGIILCAAAFLIENGDCSLAIAQADAPCMKIRTACTDAGFKAGAAKEGFGLEVDCIRPVMQGAPQRAKATKPLPKVEAELVAACKAKNPNFGQRNRAPS